MYRNYCGPVSTQTLLSHWLSPSQMPKLDTVATAEGIAPASGVFLINMTPEINRFAGVAYQTRQVYGTSVAARPSGRTAYNNIVGAEIRGYHVPLISAVQTKGASSRTNNVIYLNGWQGNKYQANRQGINAAHIVAIYGFDFTSSLHESYTLSYVEGSSHTAGNAATGRNTYNDFDFYDLYLTNVAASGLPAGLIVHLS